jgi:hypothetical protein
MKALQGNRLSFAFRKEIAFGSKPLDAPRPMLKGRLLRLESVVSH